MEELKLHHENGSIEVFGKKFTVDSDGYVSFRQVSNDLLFKDHQYGSWFIKKFSEKDDSPELGKDLRFQGNDSYSGIKIHKDDIEEFVQKVYRYRKEHDQYFQRLITDNPDSEMAKIANTVQ